MASGRSWADRPLDTTPRVCRPLGLFAPVSYIDSETLRLKVLEDTCSRFKPHADFGGPSRSAPLLFEQTRRHAVISFQGSSHFFDLDGPSVA